MIAAVNDLKYLLNEVREVNLGKILVLLEKFKSVNTVVDKINSFMIIKTGI